MTALFRLFAFIGSWWEARRTPPAPPLNPEPSRPKIPVHVFGDPPPR